MRTVFFSLKRIKFATPSVDELNFLQPVNRVALIPWTRIWSFFQSKGQVQGESIRGRVHKNSAPYAFRAQDIS